MKLAIISPYPPNVTGISQYGYHVSRVLAQSGLFSSISILAGAETSAPTEELPRMVHVDYAWKQGQAGAGLAILARLRQLKPDLVWYNLGASIFGRSPLANLISLLSLRLGHPTGMPSVVTLHEMVQLADFKALKVPGGALVRIGARLYPFLAGGADVTCLTMQRYVDWYRANHPDVVSRHIPIGSFHTPEMLPETNAPELLFFSSMAPFKGLEVLISAYRILLQKNPRVHLTIAGAPHPRFPGYTESVRRNNHDLPGIRWLGQIRDDQLCDLFERAQIVVLPYLASTGSSSVLYQAAAWGRPIIASNLQDLCSMAEETGLEVEFFERGRISGLVEAIQGLLEAPERRQGAVRHNFAIMQGLCPKETCQHYLNAFNLAFELHNSPGHIEIPAVINVECM